MNSTATTLDKIILSVSIRDMAFKVQKAIVECDPVIGRAKAIEQAALARFHAKPCFKNAFGGIDGALQMVAAQFNPDFHIARAASAIQTDRRNDAAMRELGRTNVCAGWLNAAAYHRRRSVELARYNNLTTVGA